MDYEGVLRKVDQYADLCERSMQIQEAKVSGWHSDPEWKDLDRRITEGLPFMEQVANKVDPRLAEKLRARDAVIMHKGKLEACTELRGAIQGRQEAEDLLGPQGPKLVAADMHSVVWNAAAKLWSNGHRREAIQAAATALFDHYLPAKLGRQRDTRGGKDLIGQAFSEKPPEPDAPRPRFTTIPESDKQRWTNAHEGAMKLGQGAAQAIRNLSTHDLSEPEEQESLEMLAVLSYVARLVEKADVVKAP